MAGFGDGRVLVNFRSRYPELVARLTPADVRWTSERLLRLTDAQWRDVFRAGGYTPAIGERLARLAEQSQVLVVTHSPQVAARASHHYRIEKSHGPDGTRTSVRKLDAGERREEIARMLSGASVTEEARAQASRLLDAA